MISNNQKKLIRQLRMKKYRDSSALFIAEGAKIVADMLNKGIKPHTLFCTEKGVADLKNLGIDASSNITIADEPEMKEFSEMVHATSVLAILQKPAANLIEPDYLSKILNGPTDTLVLALDDIQDPGNMGTIIRIADWFGIHNILLSPTCADPFGPKAVQASMGAIARAEITQCNLVDFFNMLDRKVPVYGTVLEGENIYRASLSQNGVILMGNEGHGLSKEILDSLTHRLLIPSYPSDAASTSESLNVAAATSVVLSEFRRRI
ncbi:MAG: RNA methyltransferase [Bacteroidales bacterium]|nr:RNA methyltransferase [Bacteroidales bacterium]